MAKTKSELENELRRTKKVLGYVLDENVREVKRYKKGIPSAFKSKDHAAITAAELDLAAAKERQRNLIKVMQHQIVTVSPTHRNKISVLTDKVHEKDESE